MGELDCEESWALKNWCFWIVVLEKTLESPLYCKEIQSVHSKRDQSWVFFGRNDTKAEIPVELFKILEDDAVKVLHLICQEIWKTQQWPQDWKRSVFIPIRKKGNAKECSNYRTIALISHVASLTWWTWVWVNSGSWWLTGRPGVLRFMGLQRVGHDWATELNWTEHMLAK